MNDEKKQSDNPVQETSFQEQTQEISSEKAIDSETDIALDQTFSDHPDGDLESEQNEAIDSAPVALSEPVDDTAHEDLEAVAEAASVPPTEPLCEDKTLSTTEEAQELMVELRDQLTELRSWVDEGFNQLRKTFDRKISMDQGKQSQIDALHKELEEYRQDIVRRTAMPIIEGNIKLFVDLDKLITPLREPSRESLPREEVLKILQGVYLDLEILLEDQGISSFSEAVPGGAFNPRRQRVTKKIPSTDPANQHLIAQSLVPGFEDDKRVIRKENVSVFFFEEE